MKAPKAPDPMQTAQAQSGVNRDTALSQQLLNMTNQNNPWGSVSYSPDGSSSYVDSTGKTVTIPRYTQTTTLTPEQQAIFNQGQAAELNLSSLANEQSAKLREYMGTPFEFNNQDAETWAYDLASPRLLAQQGIAGDQLRSQLINSGIRPGTAAYDREMTRLTNANTDQMNQLALTGRGQAFGEALATRNQPINEVTALMSGSQVSNPAQMSGATPQTQVGGVDYAGMVQQNYQNKLQSHNAMLGGLFGLAGNVGGAFAASDVRLKTEINLIDNSGALPWYSFRYNWDMPGTYREGVMAQDVLAVKPEAVVDAGGFYMVDYGMLS